MTPFAHRYTLLYIRITTQTRIFINLVDTIMTHRKPYNTYRKTLAWIGFITLYLVIPAMLALGFYTLNTQAHQAADRAHIEYCETFREKCDPFYQQTANPF